MRLRHGSVNDRVTSLDRMDRPRLNTAEAWSPRRMTGGSHHDAPRQDRLHAGPRHAIARVDPRAGRARAWTSHGSTSRTAAATSTPRRARRFVKPPRPRDARSPCSPISRDRRSVSAPSPAARRSSSRRAFAITTKPIEGDRQRGSTTYVEPPRRRQEGRRHPARRWTTTARSGAGRGRRGAYARGGRRPDLGPQGHQSAGREPERPALTDKDREDLAFALALAGRLGRSLLRPRSRGCRRALAPRWPHQRARCL